MPARYSLLAAHRNRLKCHFPDPEVLLCKLSLYWYASFLQLSCTLICVYFILPDHAFLSASNRRYPGWGGVFFCAARNPILLKFKPSSSPLFSLLVRLNARSWKGRRGQEPGSEYIWFICVLANRFFFLIFCCALVHLAPLVAKRWCSNRDPRQVCVRDDE